MEATIGLLICTMMINLITTIIIVNINDWR